jgi:hypothetical protein
MTPERLAFLVDHCRRHRRRTSVGAYLRDIAGFLEVEPITLRRWLSGQRPIPRAVELVLEILHGWPEVVTMPEIERLIREGNAKQSNG